MLIYDAMAPILFIYFFCLVMTLFLMTKNDNKLILDILFHVNQVIVLTTNTLKKRKENISTMKYIFKIYQGVFGLLCLR